MTHPLLLVILLSGRGETLSCLKFLPLLNKVGQAKPTSPSLLSIRNETSYWYTKGVQLGHWKKKHFLQNRVLEIPKENHYYPIFPYIIFTGKLTFPETLNHNSYPIFPYIIFTGKLTYPVPETMNHNSYPIFPYNIFIGNKEII